MIKKILLGLVLSLIVIFYIVMPYVYNSTNPNWKGEIGLSAYSDNWDDLSQFKDEIEHAVVPNTNARYQVLSIVSTTTSLENIGNPSKSLLVVIGVEKRYNDLEVTAIEKFVRNGGKMIIADDGGFATSISEKFGVYFYEGMLWENETYGIERDGEFIKDMAYPHINATLDDKSYGIVANKPTALRFEEGKNKTSTVNASSSRNSYLDINKNGHVDIEDKQGPMTVIIDIVVGDGKIVFISDPDIFVNGMLKRTNNGEFALAVVEHLLPSGGDIIFDESRHNQNKCVENEYQTMTFIIFMMSKGGIGFTIAGMYVEIFPSLLTMAVVVVLVVIAAVKIKDKERWAHKFDITSFKPMLTPLPKGREEQQEMLINLIKDKVRIMSSLSSEEVNKMSKEKLRKYIPDKMLIDFIENPKAAYTPYDIKKIITKLEEWKR